MGEWAGEWGEGREGGRGGEGKRGAIQRDRVCGAYEYAEGAIGVEAPRRPFSAGWRGVNQDHRDGVDRWIHTRVSAKNALQGGWAGGGTWAIERG